MNIFTSSNGFVKVARRPHKPVVKWWTVDNDAPAKQQNLEGK